MKTFALFIFCTLTTLLVADSSYDRRRDDIRRDQRQRQQRQDDIRRYQRQMEERNAAQRRQDTQDMEKKAQSQRLEEAAATPPAHAVAPPPARSNELPQASPKLSEDGIPQTQPSAVMPP